MTTYELFSRGRRVKNRPANHSKETFLKIIRVSATPLNVPVTIDVLGLDKQTSLSLCLTEIETDTGLVGHGMTAITEEEIIAAAVREVAAPALLGEDPIAT